MTLAPELSVVIPVLGNHEVLRRVLDGYDRQDIESGRFDVIVVVDPADPDPSAVHDLAGEHRATALTGTRPGASATRNTGWRSAQAPLVLFTDSDTVPAPHLVGEHLFWHGRHPEQEVVVVGAVRWAPPIHVTPFMCWLEQGVQFDFDGIAGAQAGWAHVYSANCSIKRAFLETVGGFDEARFPYGYEDLDWGARAREHGVRVLYNERAAVEHWRTMTVEQ